MTDHPEQQIGPLRVFDLFDPGKPDPVTEAEVAAHHAAYPDPRSYEAARAWKDAHPDAPSPVRRTGSVLDALFKALGPEAEADPEPEPEPELDAEAEAEWADEWDSEDSHAYMDRVEAGLEPEAEP